MICKSLYLLGGETERNLRKKKNEQWGKPCYQLSFLPPSAQSTEQHTIAKRVCVCLYVDVCWPIIDGWTQESEIFR